MVVLGNSSVTILREREDALLCPSVYCVFGYILHYSVVEFPGLPLFWEYFIKPCCFPIIKFFEYWHTHTHTHTHIYIYIYIKHVKKKIDKTAVFCILLKSRKKKQWSLVVWLDTARALWINANGVLVPKPCLTPESSSDEDFVGSTTGFFLLESSWGEYSAHVCW